MQRAPHQPLIARHPLAQLSVAFSAGILASHLFGVSIIILVGCCALCSLAGLVTLNKQKLAFSGWCLILAVLFAGAVLRAIENIEIPQNQLKRLLDAQPEMVGDPVELTGVVDGPLNESWNGIYFVLRVEGIRWRDANTKTVGLVAMLAVLPTPESKSEYEQLELRYGARLRIMTRLRRADSYRNPGVRLFTEYLDRKGYDATGFVKSALLIERLDDVPVFLPLAGLYRWRQQLQQEIDRRFAAGTAGVLAAALLNNRYNLSSATSERFRAGGTFHVLVISGLHISFIAGLVFLISRALTRRHSLRFLFSAIVLWGYTLAVGAESSVSRAALMFTVLAFGPIIFRKASSLNALGGSALFLLVWRPDNLFDPSFQLTFFSVIAIVVFAWPLLQKLWQIGSWRPTSETPYPPQCSCWLRSFCEALFWSERAWGIESVRAFYHCSLFKAPVAARLERYRLQRIARYILNSLLVSVCVQLVLLPFLVIYFHRLSIASLLLNIVVSLLMALLALVALAALLMAQISAEAAAPLITLANALNWLMVHSVDPFARIGLASMRLPHYSGSAAALYVVYFVPLAWLARALSRWNPLAPTAASGTVVRRVNGVMVVLQTLFLGVIILHPLSTGKPDGKLHIDFLDVGQGDSQVVTMPDGTTLMIDGGGRPNFSGPESQSDPLEEQFGHETRSIGEAVVSEYLWWRGLDSVDYILATHADADHIDGLNDVARNFSVRAALVARTPTADPEFQKFSETLRARGIPLSVIGRGDIMHFGMVKASVLWPPASLSAAAPSRNNDSLALKLLFGDTSMLLTGDIESGAEDAILRAGANLDVDVVKVAHHGSKTSSGADFVAATRPAVAVISVGQISMFGHPNKEVVDRWKAIGAEVLTTGRSGTITVTSNGHELDLKTFVKN